MRLLIEKYDEQINTEIMSGVGFCIFPLFAFHVSKGVQCVSIWFQFKNVQYCFCIVENDKRFKELWDEFAIYPKYK